MTNGTFRAKRLDLLLVPSDRTTGTPDLYVVKTTQGKQANQFYALVIAKPTMEKEVGKKYVTLDETDGYHEVTHMSFGAAKLCFVK
jgi:hypothetical protein